MRRRYAGGHGGFRGVYRRLAVREYWSHLEEKGYVERRGRSVRVTNFGRMPTGNMFFGDVEAYRNFRRLLIEVFRSSDYIPESRIEGLIREAVK